MLCPPCRRAILQRSSSSKHIARNLTRTAATTSSTTNAAPVTPTPSIVLPDSTPPALSSSAPSKSQPLSTPHTSPPSTTKSSHLKEAKLRGSLPGGAELRGISYLKSHPAIHAKEDDEYPSWLWSLLSPHHHNNSSSSGGPDVSSMTKKQRQKHDRKQERERLRAGPSVKVALHEQSVDLTSPGDTAVDSLEKRQLVVRSSRTARRKGIREANFLQSM